MSLCFFLAFLGSITNVQGNTTLPSTSLSNTSPQKEHVKTSTSIEINGTSEQTHETTDTTERMTSTSGLLSTLESNSTMVTTINNDRDHMDVVLELTIAVICFAEVFLIASVCFVWKARRDRDNFFRLHDMTDDNASSEEVKPKSIVIHRKSRLSHFMSQNGDRRPSHNNSYTQTENELMTSVQNQNEAAVRNQNEAMIQNQNEATDQITKDEKVTNRNDCSADPNRKSGSSIKSWILRSSSFRISQLFGRRASKSKCTSGVYEEPWDNTTLSGNIRNPTSKFYVEIEDDIGVDATQDDMCKKSSIELKSMETIAESTHTLHENTQL